MPRIILSVTYFWLGIYFLSFDVEFLVINTRLHILCGLGITWFTDLLSVGFNDKCVHKILVISFMSSYLYSSIFSNVASIVNIIYSWGIFFGQTEKHALAKYPLFMFVV